VSSSRRSRPRRDRRGHHGADGAGAPAHAPQVTTPGIKAPVCSVPSTPKIVFCGFALDWKVNVPEAPENVPRADARARRPRKASGSVGATAVPLPARRAGPVARHVISQLTVAGTSTAGGPGESITARPGPAPAG